MLENVNLVIIGASGFIGSHLYAFCKENKINVAGTYCSNKAFDELIYFDMRHESYIDLHNKLNNVSNAGKKFVILCSANTNIDECKKAEKESYELNIKSTKRIIDEVLDIGDKLVFISSGNVFDGIKGCYDEEDIPNPITLYGMWKYEIEQYITKKCKDVIIFRVSRAVGSQFGEHDIFDDFYKKIITNKEIICLKDYSFCFTDVNDIAEAIVLAIKKNLHGLFHLSSNNYMSRYELAVLYANKIFNGYEKITERTDIGFLDKRPIFAGLNGEKLKRELGIEYRTIKEILDSYKKNYLLTNAQKGD